MNLNAYTRGIAAAAALSFVATAASAISVSPLDTPLSAGDSTLGNAVADPFEDFGMTTLSFTAAEGLKSMTSITVNPYRTDVSGNPANGIMLSYSINGGTAVDLPIIPVLTTGSSRLTKSLKTGDLLTFFITGTAGQSGNQVTYAVETTAPVPVPAAAILLTTGLGALSLGRRRKNKKV